MSFVIEKCLSTSKEKIYHRTIRPAILYSTEYWVVKSQQENKCGVVGMGMSFWMSEHSRHNRIGKNALEKSSGDIYL